MIEKQRLVSPDFFLLILTVILTGFGFAMMASASNVFSLVDQDNSWHFAMRQLFFIGIGIGAMIFIMFWRPANLVKFSKLYVYLSLLGLILVLMFGSNVNGAQSWFGFGSFGVQPTEFAKLAVILCVVYLITTRGQAQYERFKRGMLPSIFLTAVFIFFIMQQPDLGSSIIIGGTAALLIFIGGSKLMHYLGFAGALTIAGVLFIMKELSEGGYKADRITAFLNPDSSTLGAGYQLKQSFYAFAHGGFTGQGYGESVQKLAGYLPMPYNDFIFPVIAEEMGFVGVLFFFTVLILYLARALHLSMKAENLGFRLVGVGIVIMLSIQVLVNIGGVTGTIPMTGVTLPFVSYGGSSILATLICAGILLNISRQVKKKQTDES